MVAHFSEFRVHVDNLGRLGGRFRLAERTRRRVSPPGSAPVRCQSERTRIGVASAVLERP